MFICVLCVKHYMKAQTTAISQDGSAGEFFCQGALITHVNTAARTAECHAFSFGRAPAGSKAGARRAKHHKIRAGRREV